MEKRDFLTMPQVIVKSGLWAKMSPSDRAVYVVLCHYANYKTSLCFPGIATISKMSGVHKNNVCKSIQRLSSEYKLITKKRASQGFKFRNLYRIIADPKLDPSTFPHDTEKKCKKPYREKSGKFGVRPCNTESDICPPNTEAVHPSNTESKYNQMKESLKRDSFSPKPIISQKTFKALEEAKGKDWVAKEMKKKGYVVVLENPSPIEGLFDGGKKESKTT